MRRLGIVLAMAFTFATSGCSAVESVVSTPTCAEYAAMSTDTGLMSDVNDKQRAALKGILAKHGKETGEQNVSLAALQVVAYCNIYGGHAGNNDQEPIDNIPGLQE